MIDPVTKIVMLIDILRKRCIEFRKFPTPGATKQQGKQMWTIRITLFR